MASTHPNGMVGRTLGHYSVLEKLGAGGMEEVYRAIDTRLGRDVALKVVRHAFAGDPERLARFEREARLLASLNHPNIATLHGLEESEGVHFLVMELVPGETLDRRIARGAIPLDESIAIFRQTGTGGGACTGRRRMEAAPRSGSLRASTRVTHTLGRRTAAFSPSTRFTR